MSRLRALIVEDSETDAKLLVHELRAHYEPLECQRVDTAPSMRAALDTSSWDVVLSDWSMPRFSGSAALALMKESGLDIPFIIVSGTVGEEVAVAAMQAGARDFMLKGHLGRLAAAIDRELREGRARRAAEAKYRTLFESSADAILISDVETQAIEDANPAAARLFGYDSASLRTMSIPDLVPAEARAVAMTTFQAHARGETALAECMPALKKDGTRILLDISAARMVVDGRPMVAGFLRDVTERERARTDRQRLAMAIEQADVAVVITNASGDIEYVNPSFSTSSGYTREEVIGRNPRVLKSGVQDDAFYRALWATLAAGRTWTGRLVNRKKDGTLFTEEVSISPVRDAAGVTTSYVGVKRDITAALALEAQYLQAQKMEVVGRLAGGVAHDFNNVLSIILSYAELIGSDLEAGDPLRADVEEITRAGLRAAGLTRQLLTFSRRQALERKVLDLNVQLASMENMLRRLLGADIDLNILAGDQPQAIEGDPGQIEQIVMNLAVNARDAMPDGGRLTIETANVELEGGAHEGQGTGAFVRVTVTDTGVGMSQETQAHIFEPFFTTKNAGRGTGLGLATVFGIVQQSKGFIRVTSAVGRGTSFELYFPRHSGAVPRASTCPPELVAPLGSETILLVEDADDLRAVARTILHRHGYRVIDAPNAGEALLVCEKHESEVHLLLTDVVMPRMGGRELADRLAGMRPDMRVLFMSGYTDDSNMLRGILDGEVNLIQKPFTPGSLARKVREVLDAPR